MKNMILTLAMVILCVTFIIFQQDINLMQTQGVSLTQISNDAARAAALTNDIEDYSVGYITYKTTHDEAVKKAEEIIRSDFDLSNRLSQNTYYKDNTIDTYIYLFDQEESSAGSQMYYSYKNGTSIRGAKSYETGKNASEYIKDVALPKGFDPVLENPCVICIIDTGSARFTIDSFTRLSSLKKGGIYEYYN